MDGWSHGVTDRQTDTYINTIERFKKIVKEKNEILTLKNKKIEIKINILIKLLNKLIVKAGVPSL